VLLDFDAKSMSCDAISPMARSVWRTDRRRATCARDFLNFRWCAPTGRAVVGHHANPRPASRAPPRWRRSAQKQIGLLEMPSIAQQPLISWILLADVLHPLHQPQPRPCCPCTVLSAKYGASWLVSAAKMLKPPARPLAAAPVCPT
jgi:hypothetical protein